MAAYREAKTNTWRAVYRYAMCLRELQITVYQKEENSHNVTYGQLRRNAELLTYLCNNNIHSDEDFRNTVNAAAEKSDKLKKIRDGLLAEIEQEEKLLHITKEAATTPTRRQTATESECREALETIKSCINGKEEK